MMTRQQAQTIRELYDVIRANPRPMWDGVGYYCGDGVWLDPATVGQQGEIEHLPNQAPGLLRLHQGLQRAQTAEVVR